LSGYNSHQCEHAGDGNGSEVERVTSHTETEATDFLVLIEQDLVYTVQEVAGEVHNNLYTDRAAGGGSFVYI
jgi:hypothetical protein